MDRYHLIRHPLGGSDVYDSMGNQVGYSLPSILGDGEDFYDMEGNPVGQSFDSVFGGEGFMGMGDGHGSYGFMDEEIMMGRNAWLNGELFKKEEEQDQFALDSHLDFMEPSSDINAGDGFDAGPVWNDSGF